MCLLSVIQTWGIILEIICDDYEMCNFISSDTTRQTRWIYNSNLVYYFGFRHLVILPTLLVFSFLFCYAELFLLFPKLPLCNLVAFINLKQRDTIRPRGRSGPCHKKKRRKKKQKTTTKTKNPDVAFASPSRWEGFCFATDRGFKIIPDEVKHPPIHQPKRKCLVVFLGAKIKRERK